MRIFSTALLTAAFLGSAVSDGWCPEPADLTTPPSERRGAVAVPPKPPKPTAVPYWRGASDAPMRYGKPSQNSGAMDRLSGSPFNPAGSGKGAAGGVKERRPSATGAAKPAAGGGAVLQSPPRSGPIDYGGCAGCKKPDTFRHPR